MKGSLFFINLVKKTVTVIVVLLLAACSNFESIELQNTPEPSVTPTMALPTILEEPYPIEVVELPYTSQLFLDVYSPSAEGSWPVVVVFHGSDENKNMTSYLSKKIAEQGAVVFTPTWRIKDATPFYPGCEDVACSIRFARLTAQDFGGNPDRITVVGHSAGGSAAAIMFLATNGFEGDCLVNGGSSKVDAFVGLDGVYDFRALVSEEIWNGMPEKWDRINPVFYLPSEPVKDDRVIYLLNSSITELKTMALNFREDLIRVGFNPNSIDLPNVNHTSIIWPAPDEVIRAVVASMRAEK